MNAINITYTSDESQIKAVKAFLKALKIQFEITKESKKISESYNPEFVAKIEKSKQDYKDGNFITVEKDDFKKFLGLE